VGIWALKEIEWAMPGFIVMNVYDVMGHAGHLDSGYLLLDALHRQAVK